MVVVLIAGAALSVLNQTSISPMLPVVMEEFGVSSSTAQWLVSGYALVTAVVIPVTAYLMKRFSTRAVFFVSIVLFAIGSVLCAVAPVFPVLMAGRIFQAACAGMLMPLATNIMLLVFPPEKRGFAMGLYTLITTLTPAIGMSVAGIMADSIGWRAVYAVMMGAAVVVALVAVFSLQNYGETARVALDVPSVILSALGLVSLLYGISLIGDTGLDLTSGALLVIGVVVIALFVVRQTRLTQPVLNMAVFKYRRFVIGLIIVALVMLVTNAPAVALPIVVQQGLGQSASVTGMMVIPASIIGAIATLTAGRLFDRIGGRPLAIVGSFVLLAAYAGFALMVPEYGVLWLAVCMILSNVGMMFVNTPLNTWALGFLPDELIPHGNAMSNTIRQVFMSISSTMFVTILAVSMASSSAPQASEAVLQGGCLAFTVEAVLCVVVLILVLTFVKSGEEAEFEQALPADPVNAKARDVMRINVPFLTEDMTVRGAMELFTREGVTDSPVIDAQGHVIAFLSSSDIMRQLVARNMLTPDYTGLVALAQNADMQSRLAEIIDRNVMGMATKNVITVHADSSFEHVCTLLAQKRFKKVPVVEDGRLVGTINRDDVVHHIMDALAKANL